jgi:hypothetical protein
MADELTGAAFGDGLFEAVKELMKAASSRRRTREVIAERPELLTDAGLVEADRIVAATWRGIDDQLDLANAYQLDVLKRCRTNGVEETLAALDDATSATTLALFLKRATSAASTRRFIKGARVVDGLLRDTSVAEVERLVQLAHDAGHARALEWDHLPWLLRACRQVGIEAAIPNRFRGTFTLRHGRREVQGLLRRTQRALALFRAAGHLVPLDEAIAEWTRISTGDIFLHADPAAQAAILSSTAMLLNIRADGTGSVDDLRHSLTLTARAWPLAELGSSTPLSIELRHPLVSALRQRGWGPGSALPGVALNHAYAAYALYERTGEDALLGQALVAGEAAVRASAAEPTAAGKAHLAVSIALSARFAATGEVEDLGRADQAMKGAMCMMAPWSDDWPGMLIYFAALRWRRASILGDIGALEQAATALRLVLAKTAPESVDHVQARGLLGVVLHGFAIRPVAGGPLPDVQRMGEAISHLECAAAMLPGSSVAIAARGNLARALDSRYLMCHDPGDIDRAISLWKELVADVPVRSPQHAWVVGHLGGALVDRHERLGIPDDLVSGIAYLRQAIDALPNDPLVTKFHHDLGVGLQALWGAHHDQAAAEEAEQAYRTACVRGLQICPEMTISAAREWSQWAMRCGDWARAAEACRYGLDAAVILVRTQSGRHHQEAWLSDAKGLADRGAYALAECGDLEGAVMLLEQGRTVLLSDLLDLDRREMEELRGVGRADLYERFVVASERLALASAWALLPTSTDLAVTRPPVGATRAELDAVVAEIRCIHGFEDFLRLPSFEDVLSAARGAPLVYLVVTEVGGVALSLGVSAGVMPCWLPELSNEAMAGLIDDIDATPGFGSAQDSLCRCLWDVVMGPLLAAFKPARQLVVISAGAASVMPLHAAWTEDPSAPSGRRYALDVAAVTYAPSARTLLARSHLPEVADGALVIDDPRPVSASPLPHSGHEAEAVAAAFPGSRRLTHEAATADAVLGLLSSCSVAHFSCHGFADWAAPLNSGLIMANDEVVTLRDVLALRLTRMRLVTLSACESAMPGVRIPDEAVSLPTALLAAGVPGVVASLWPVIDEATALLMRRFYDLWIIENLAPYEALRQAQRWIRDATNAELAEKFPDAPRCSPPMELGEAAVTFWGRARPYSDPFIWAAFTYTGL